MNKTARKILILRFSSIGDIILTTPVIRCLKTQLAGSEVHYATKKGFKALLETNPYIDKVHLLGDSDTDLIAALKLEGFDLIIDLHHNIRTARIKRALGVQSNAFDKLNFKKFLLVNLKINQMPDIHIVDRYMETVKELGVTNDGQGLDYFIAPDDQVDVKGLPAKFKTGFVTYAIGGQHQTKKLPVLKMIELCTSIKSPIVLLGGPDDVHEAAEIENHFGGASKIYNAVGKVNLNQSASYVNQSLKLYTHDTGMMHIGAALKKAVVSIWGNTVPEFGMYPYLVDHQILEVKGLNCRPCSKIGFDQCPKGHFKCMNNQTFLSL